MEINVPAQEQESSSADKRMRGCELKQINGKEVWFCPEHYPEQAADSDMEMLRSSSASGASGDMEIDEMVDEQMGGAGNARKK